MKKGRGDSLTKSMVLHRSIPESWEAGERRGGGRWGSVSVIYQLKGV